MIKRLPNIGWAKDLVVRHRRKLFVFQAVVLVGLGVWLGYVFSPTTGGDRADPKDNLSGGDGPAKASAEPTKWTCSMHPQIQMDGPGKCPICGMSLIPVQSGQTGTTALRQLTISPEARALREIQSVPAERRHVTAEVRMVGKVDYDETRFKYITAWVSGRLDRLFVDYAGMEVKPGDHMVYLYSEELYSAQDELIQALKYAPDRAGGARTSRTAGIDLLESTREKLRLLGLTDRQIQEIEARGKPSEHITIYAPIGGVVIEKLRQEGDRVRTGDRIYTIADLSQVWVKLDAYESDLAWLRYGQKVTFETESYPGETFEGRIAFIDPFLKDKTRTVKVRVNVPNEDGRLKPDMFVRATVRAKVATGGQVVDPDLAGKWMCPMHPEVVQEERGTCSICGMALVTTESLGFVAPEESDETKPLVVPVSSVLPTGTRAVVYVEDPEAEVPTFEGREIVLGPRAGDYYIVRHGLGEGELVVTNGNFMLDSEIQIQARPSMMTPEGGAEKTIQEKLIDLPFAFRKQLKGLVEARQAVTAALQAKDLEGLRRAFKTAAAVLDAMDPAALEEEHRPFCKEMAMLLGNDAFEGGEVKELDEAQRIVEGFQHNLQRLDRRFHLAQQIAKLPERLDVPPAFQAQLAPLWQAYLATGAALAGDDFAKANQAAVQAEQALARIDMKLLADQDAHIAWMSQLEKLKKLAAALAGAKDIEAQRVQFAPFSEQIEAVALQFGFGRNVPVYRLHCPMALDGKGAVWLQSDGQARNPYYGSAMLGCHDQIERIAEEE